MMIIRRRGEECNPFVARNDSSLASGRARPIGKGDLQEEIRGVGSATADGGGREDGAAGREGEREGERGEEGEMARGKGGASGRDGGERGGAPGRVRVK